MKPFAMKTLNSLTFSIALVLSLTLKAQAQTAPTAPAPAPQDWPQKTIHLISPFSAGSSVDIMARLISPPLSKMLGQAVVVENKAGAGGNLGADAVAKAAADGYTLGIVTTGPMAINPSLMAHVPYNPVKDFAPVVLLAAGPNVLVVNANMPVNNLDDLIKLLKANPGKYSYGSSGVGSTNHLAGELFAFKTNTKMIHIPYKGNQDALNDVLSGQITMTFSGLQPLLSNLQAGKIKALVIAGDKRMPAIADVPTVAEVGLKGAEVMPWYGVVAPAGTPASVIHLLNKNISEIMARPEIYNQFKSNGSEPNTGTPAQFAELIASDVERWGEVIKRAGIQSP
jgi:tripartite-type tricarboxylate transporter receptor subunit TctC